LLGVVAEVLTIFVVPTPPGGLLGFCLQTWEPPGNHSGRVGAIADVDALLASMSLEEQIAQLLSVEEMQSRCGEAARLGLGSVMWGANGHPGNNRPEDWRFLMRTLQGKVLMSAPGVPLLYATDSVHGNSHVRHSVLFPHNIALGSARNTTLVEAIGEATARDSAALGFSWLYAPCVAVVHDVRWGRSYESFSQDANIVASLAAAYVRGVKRAKVPVMTTAKHYIGDGASRWGTGRHGSDAKPFGIDRGDAELTQAELEEQMKPFQAVVDAGVEGIMVSYGSVNGTKMHRHKTLLAKAREPEWKGGLGFDGIVVSDYGGVDMLGDTYETSVKEAMGAGIDVIMVARPLECGTGFNCPRPQDAIDVISKLVSTQQLSRDKVEASTRRVLKVKSDIGLFESPFASPAPDGTAKAHKALARTAAAQSVVLLQSNQGVLPLQPGRPGRKQLCIAGTAAADLGLQCGGWTLSWQGMRGDAASLGTEGVTLLDAATEWYGAAVTFDASGACADSSEVILAVIAEEPYAEYLGDVEDLKLRAEDASMLDRVVSRKSAKKVLLSLAGRPLHIDRWLRHFDVVALASLPGSEGGHGIWDVMSGLVKPRGRLPFTWPREGAQMPVLPGDEAKRREDVLFPLGFAVDVSTQ